MASATPTLDEFYEGTYVQLVSSMTLVTAGDRAAAEDAVQEAFVRLVPRWASVSRYEDPSYWVRRVAFNILQDGFRRRTRFHRLRHRIAREDSYEDAPSPPDELTEILADLDPAHRIVLALRGIYDMPLDAIAVELNVPVGTIKSRLARARAAAAAHMKEAEHARTQ